LASGEHDEPKTFRCPYDPERAAAVFAAHMTAASIGLFGAKLEEITGLTIGVSPDPHNGEGPDLSGGESHPATEAVSANGDDEIISANGHARTVSTNADGVIPPPAFRKGQGVRYCGLSKVKHATTGTIESVMDCRRRGGSVSYLVQWDDGPRHWQPRSDRARLTIEALEPPASDEPGGSAELDPDAVLILKALGESPDGLTPWQIARVAPGGRRRVADIRTLLERLAARGMVEPRMKPNGRPSGLWALADPPDGEGDQDDDQDDPSGADRPTGPLGRLRGIPGAPPAASGHGGPASPADPRS
jgi:hypothetical protein